MCIEGSSTLVNALALAGPVMTFSQNKSCWEGIEGTRQTTKWDSMWSVGAEHWPQASPWLVTNPWEAWRTVPSLSDKAAGLRGRVKLGRAVIVHPPWSSRDKWRIDWDNVSQRLRKVDTVFLLSGSIFSSSIPCEYVVYIYSYNGYEDLRNIKYK